jgi:SAM-dependent methyltransferase
MKTRVTQEDGDIVREFFKRWPRMYYIAVQVLGPVLFVGLSPRAFLKKYHGNGITLNVGSGPRVLAPGVINVDLIAYEHTDVVADVAALPFEDGSVSRVVSDQMLEHIERPENAVAEISRILEAGGYFYLSTPFVYPFHASPYDYTRWTVEGLKSLLTRHEIEVLEYGLRGGPFSVLILWLAYLLASLLCFGNKRIHTVILNVVIVLCFPIKILDIVAARLPFMSEFTSVLYIVGRKQVS